jgi:hypothetical protein
MKNFGKMHFNPIKIPPVYMYQTEEQEERGDPKIVMIPEKTVYQLANADDIPWKDVDKTPVSPDDWYILVEPDGWIMCCEKDPTLLAVEGYDVLRISHPGPRDAIFCQRWTGKEVVPWDAS